MLSISSLAVNAELFGTVTIRVVLSDCDTIVNDWNLVVDGCPDAAIDFVESVLPEEEDCKASDCPPATCDVPDGSCMAVFEWDTTSCPDGSYSIYATARGETSPSIPITVNNIQPSYRVLNKKLISGEIVEIIPPKIEIEVPDNVAELIESLPMGVLMDIELGAHERFTIPISGKDVLIGETLIQRILDLKGYSIRKMGDKIEIDLSEEAASYFMQEFATTGPKIEVGLEDSVDILDGDIDVLDAVVFPATHAKVIEEGD